MKIVHSVTGLFVGILLLITFSCGRKNQTAEAPFQPVLDVKGIPVEMVEMQPGTFSMGCVPDGRKLTGAEEIHQVVIPGYAIMAQQVSPELWKAVTGKDGKISYDEAVKFAAKVAKWTGLPVQVAWEDQWEYAARKGWLGDGGIHPVKGIRELTSRWDDEKIGAVVRTETERAPIASYTKAGDISFRLTWNTGKAIPSEVYSTIVENKPPIREAIDYQAMKPGETLTVNGVSFKMIAIEGGAFTMGATPSQTAFDYAKEDEKPAHDVIVSDFALGETEVTVGLWQAVMGSLPYGNNPRTPEIPVGNVSWYGAQEFIMKLNALTGRKFRLPEEEEWEYAARGGKKGGDLRYAGSTVLGEVAVYTPNGSEKPARMKPVKSLRPNGLGLYDMSGNAWEWCRNGFHLYGKEEVHDEWRVMRGGSAASLWDACRVSNRSKIPATSVKSTFGLRLAL